MFKINNYYDKNVVVVLPDLCKITYYSRTYGVELDALSMVLIRRRTGHVLQQHYENG